MTASTRPFSASAVDRFAAAFAGDIIRPADDGYDDARRVWNAMIDRRPALIVRPTSVDEVAMALRFGREAGLAIAVRSGGSFTGHMITAAAKNEAAISPNTIGRPVASPAASMIAP